MALTITRNDAKQAFQRLEAIKRRVASVREQAAAATEQVVATGTVAGTAFAIGFAQGKTGRPLEVFGAPGELVGGLALTGFALLGGAGKSSKHLANVGRGALAAYAATLGNGTGLIWANKASAPRVSGDSLLTPQEVMMAQRAAAAMG